MPKPGDSNFRRQKPPIPRLVKIPTTGGNPSDILVALQARADAQKGILDDVASKIVGTLGVARRREPENPEAWGEVLGILRQTRDQVEPNEDNLQFIIDHHITAAANSITAAMNSSPEYNKKVADGLRFLAGHPVETDAP
jgi:hypothetical protein